MPTSWLLIKDTPPDPSKHKLILTSSPYWDFPCVMIYIIQRGKSDWVHVEDSNIDDDLYAEAEHWIPIPE